MTSTTADEVAKHLSSLEEQDFENEVCAFFQRRVQGFQPIPAGNLGDAGLDGLSHQQTCAYCCYGPKQTGTLKKVGSKTWNDAVIKKFRSDLRTICELESDGANGWKHKETPLAKTIFGKGNKIEQVFLIVSIFPNPEVIGPLNTAFVEYLAATNGNYIQKTATLTIWGSNEVANMGADDLMLLRLQQRVAVKTMRDVYETPPPPSTTTTDFDAKFDWLRKKADAAGLKAIDRFAEHYRRAWAAAVAVDDDFANISEELHKGLAYIRDQAINEAMVADHGNASDAKATLRALHAFRDRVKEKMRELLEGGLDPELASRTAEGETGRLIGECHIDWRNS